MGGEKIRSARQATAAAIAELRDGVAFAVDRGRPPGAAGLPGRRDRPGRRAHPRRGHRPGRRAAGRRRHRDRHLALGGPRPRRPAPRCGPPRDPADRRAERREHPRVPAGRPQLRRGVHLRLPGRRHRLAGRRAAHGGLVAARLRRHRGPARRPGGRLPRADRGRDGEERGRAVAAAVDAAGGDGAVPQAGRAGRGGSHRPPRRGRPATGRLPAGRVGRGEPRLPPVHGRHACAGERPGAGGPGRAGPGRVAGRVRAGERDRRVDRRRGAVERHRPQGRALHRPGRAGGGGRRRPRRARGGRRRPGRGAPRRGGAARGGVGSRRHRATARGRRRGARREDRHGPAARGRRQGGHDGAGRARDPDYPGGRRG